MRLEDVSNLEPAVLYYMYLTIGVMGLDALGSYSAETNTWGDQHHRVSTWNLAKTWEWNEDSLTVI